MDRVYILKKYTFVPPDFIASLESMLFSSGELQSVMLDHCIEKINIWFSNIISLPHLSERYEKIALFFDEIGNSLASVRLEPKSQALQIQIIKSIIMNQILNFADLLGTLSFDGYELSSLAFHILVCDLLSKQVGTVKVRLSDGRIFVNDSTKSSSNNNCGFSDDSIGVDGPLIDSLRTALAASSEAAAVCAVVKLRDASGEIMPLFFNEKIKVVCN
jgi:hypothetical protein